MTSSTYSTLDLLTADELLDLLKRLAKQDKKAASQPHLAEQKLSYFQDQIAAALGHKNWSMLHKNISPLAPHQLGTFQSIVESHPHIGPRALEACTFDAAEAIKKMKRWAEGKYSRLVEFAYLDRESPTGFAWPDVDMDQALLEEFYGQYPEELIVRAAHDLELEGPWGLEDYGHREADDPDSQPPTGDPA